MLTATAAVPAVGAAVRLRGLGTEKFNSHVGRVIAPLNEKGRLSVRMHGAVWPATGDGHESDSVTRLSVKPENLRPVRSPVEWPTVPPLHVGCAPEWALVRLLGPAGWGLPEHIAQSVTEHLHIARVHAAQVQISSCSSDRGDFPLAEVLNTNKSTWWITESGSMPLGRGSEWLELQLGPEGAAAQLVSFVGVRIPPLPFGPLSVRRFHILWQSAATEGHWVQSGEMQTLDCADLQEFALVPPVEAERLRLVCTVNAAAEAAALEAADDRAVLDCVGLFQVGVA